jgi:RNA polymerase sigma-70 factor (ECF subfamily)
MAEESVLAERMRRGDEGALAAAFESTRDCLAGIVALRLDPQLSGRVDVEDVLQEAWLSARQRLSVFSRDGFQSPLVWLRQIVLQTLVDTRRHQAAQIRDPRREAAAGHTATSREIMVRQMAGRYSSPSRIVGRVELARRIDAVIARLNPLDQEIIALRHYEQLGTNQVAEILGLKASAASLPYVRALERLRARLDAAGLSAEQQEL